ncbi:MAG: class I SAM-dependent methyltransferase [Anaerolineae bacterium]|nr:class I SAM-dependent methyltransferase [Anaerolineae bacterium]
MFHSIRETVLSRMQYLEQVDAGDRKDGTPHLKRLRQIAPETGKFLALLAAGAPDGDYLEIGTSAGYSTMWLALAADMLGRSITTFEVLPGKARLATETFHIAQMEEIVKLVEGDARQYLPQYERIGFCFLDAEKEVYEDCYDLVIPRLVKGGLLVADNAISHQDTLGPLLDKALADERVDALVVPVGRGELVCRKL